MDSYLAAKQAEKKAAAMAELMAMYADSVGLDFVVKHLLPRLIEIGRECKETLEALPEKTEETA